MPLWLQVILGASALVVAIHTLWTRLLKPTAKLITTTEEMLPLLRELTDTFHGTPHAFDVLDQIVAQFRTDSGSSLRDVVNRLEEGANVLKLGLETAKQLAEQDRAQLQKLIVLLDRVTIKVDAASAATTRIESAALSVADDLAAAHKRADDTHHSEPAGTAADAAAQQTTKEKLKDDKS